MFELLCSLSVDAAAGRATGEAFVPADHPLFADHFPVHTTLPGTLAVELAAQVAGPLAEEVTALRHGRPGGERYAVLGMIRNAKFLHPVPLPARLAIEVEVRRSDLSQVTVAVAARVGETEVLRGELLLAMVEATAAWSAARALRDERVARWKQAAPHPPAPSPIPSQPPGEGEKSRLFLSLEGEEAPLSRGLGGDGRGVGGEGPCETVILGAGPAGLAAAYCLARRGRPYLLLEQGGQAGAALGLVDPEMTFVSPTPLSRLPGMESLAGEAPYLTLERYVELLERYRRQHGLEVTTGMVDRVDRVERRTEPGSSGFAVSYRDAAGASHTVAARFVINATGVISTPVLPAGFDPAAIAIPWCHSREARRATLAAARRLLVVGGGISADDVIGTWLQVRRPGERAWIALRSKLWTAPKSILGIDVHYWVWLIEQMPIVPWVWRKFRHNPILGATLPGAIRRGEVLPVPPVARYREDRLELPGGELIDPDLIVFATGFSYATPHLGNLFRWPARGRPRVRRCESLDAPGLFLLGLHFGRTFASPFLRGIARDADYVARRIARTVRREAR